MAKQFNCKLIIFDYKGRKRYPLSIAKTISVLIIQRPKLLFVQNPSMILAGIGCLYKKIFGKCLIVDRHSNFMITKKRWSLLYKIMYNIFNRYTIKNSDITIVTNSFISKIVKELGGNAYILPDKIPNFKRPSFYDLKGKTSVLFIASHHLDEPLVEVINAGKAIIKHNIYIYITGDFSKINKMKLGIPHNVTFTGYLPEDKYINILNSVDIILVLTNNDKFLLCGCYEAIGVEKPLITSNKITLKNYFTDAVFVENCSKDIAKGIIKVSKNLMKYEYKVKNMKINLENDWEKRFEGIVKNIKNM